MTGTPAEEPEREYADTTPISPTDRIVEADAPATGPSVSNYEQPTVSASDVDIPLDALIPLDRYSKWHPARPRVGPGHALALWMKNAMNFNGRASRTEYWWVMAFLAVLYLVIPLVVGNLANAELIPQIVGLIVVISCWGILPILLAAPTLALSARRLHDTNRSAFWNFFYLIPVTGAVVVAYCCAKPSNPYGVRFDPVLGNPPVE